MPQCARVFALGLAWLALSGTVLAAQAAAPPSLGQPAPANNAAQPFVIQRLETRVVWQNDGTGTRETQASFQVQSAAGVQALAILAFPYTQGDESVTVLYVRVRQPDGTVVATPAENIRDMPADVSRVAPMYSDLMEKQAVVKGLDVGDTLEYDIRVNQLKPLVPGQFWFAYTFERKVVCQDEELELDLPAARAVAVVSPGYTPAITEADGNRIYRWKTSNAAPAKPANPAAPQPAPSVQATTFQNWAQVGAWYDGLQQPQTAVTPAIRAKAAALTQGLTGDDARIQALYGFVAQRIHYVSLSFGIGRYQPHSADDVLSNGYGDCKDKSTLLEALLRAAGYTAWPALVNLTQTVDGAVSSPGQFDHLVTVVERGARQEWLDATSEVAPAGWLAPTLRGQSALLVPDGAPARLVTIPDASPVANSEDFNLKGALSADGTLTAHVDYTFSGDSAVPLRMALLAASPAHWQELMQAVVGFLGFGGKVSNVQAPAVNAIEQPLVISYDYRREGYSDWSDHQIQPPLPLFFLSKWQDNGDPAVLGPDSSHSTTAHASITLPPSFGLVPTKNTDAVTDFATYHSRYHFADGTYTAERSLAILKKTVPAAEKTQFEAFTKAINDDVDVWTVLRPPAGPVTPADHSNALTATGLAQYQQRDFTAAADSLRQAVALNPANNSAWNDLGLADMAQHKLDAAAQDFQHAIAADASDPFAYNNLGRVFELEGKADLAEAQFRKQIAINPQDRFAHANLGELLDSEHQYALAVPELKAAAGIADSGQIEYELGEAELGTHHTADAMTAFHAALQSTPTPLMENNVAFALADAGLELDTARQHAEAAIAALDKLLADDESPNLTLIQQLYDVSLLGASWDTLGWIDFKQGDLVHAASYVAAAWSLTGNPDEGDHLAQIYEKMGRRTDAEALYAQVDSLNGSYHAQLRLRALAGSDVAAQDIVLNHAGDTSKARVIAIPAIAQGRFQATVDLSFAPGPKLLSVREESGDPLPRDLQAQWSSVRFPILFPDGSHTRIIRRARLSCGDGTPGCSLVLIPADSLPAN